MSLLGPLARMLRPADRAPVQVGGPARPLMRTLSSGAAHTGANLDAMGLSGTVFAIVNRTAEAAAGVTWRLYRRQEDRRRRYAHEGMDERREVTQHQALKVWQQPNPHMTGADLVEGYVQHMMLTGESWWVVGKVGRAGGGIPVELWPAMPDRMRPVEHPTEFISGYEYTNPDGSTTLLDQDEVLFSRRNNPHNPYRGIGPLQAVLTRLRTVEYSERWNEAFFLNSAEPGGIIKVDRPLSDREYQRLQIRWNEQYRGAGNAHRVGILDGDDMQWVPRQQSHRDMQFAELGEQGREVIREAFGFPKPMLGAVDNVNRANAEAADVMFARWLLAPTLDRVRQLLNSRFLPMFGPAGENVEFDYDNPVPEDRDAEDRRLTGRVNAFIALVKAGGDPVEAAQLCGLPPITISKPTPAPAASPPGTPTPGDPEEDSE